MKIARSAARIGRLFGRVPSGVAFSSLVAFAALSPAAHAVVVVSPASNIVVPATTAGIYINVVSGVSNTVPASAPGWDINPWGSTTLNFFTPTAAGSATGGSYVAATTSSAPITLALGSTVGASSIFSNSAGAVTFGAAAGNWSLNSTNYFGFRFIGDDTLLHYGYGTVIVGATATSRSIGQLFYESDANTAITITAVPEPSSAAMLLLGGGVLGAVALRRRRRAEH